MADTIKDLRDALFDILTSDSTYLSLLGDPASYPYQTYYLRPPTSPTLPQVVFTFRPSTVDGMMGRDVLSSRIPVAFTVWATDDTYETIASRIVYLLLHATGQTVGFRATLDTDGLEELYDEELNARGKVLVFTLFFRRAVT